jgi:cephalosporin hydroxylase
MGVTDQVSLPKTQPVKVREPSAEAAANLAEWKHLFEEAPGDRAFYQDRELLQFQSDLARYVDLINELEPTFVIEIGRADAGTALFLADLLGDGQQLVSIDIMGPQPDHDRIVYIEGHSTSPLILDEVRSILDGKRALVLIDGDHTGCQVARELDAYGPFADYMVVEDTVVELLGWPDGPHTALKAWLPDHPEFERDPDPQPTQHPGGWLRRI